MHILSECNNEHPAEEPGAIHLGHDVYIAWDQDGGGFIWHHPMCHTWNILRFLPDPTSTGHILIAGGPQDTEHLTVVGSLVCPIGCGAHGFIRNGNWVPC